MEFHICDALPYKNVFFRLKQREEKYHRLPSETDWTLAAEICGMLKVFYSATELFSGTKYATSNLLFPKVCEIRMSISQWMNSGYDVIRIMASKMMTKFEKYWKDVGGVMAVAVVLDPRYKMKLIEFYFPKIYGSNFSIEIERIRKLCCALLKEYQLKFRLSEESSHFNDSFNTHMEVTHADEDADPLMNFDLFLSNTTIVDHGKSELDCYLEESLLPRTQDHFDILTWWKTNGIKYPILSEIARDILAIPISSVASESAFSTGGRCLSQHRSKLLPKTLEALMCTQIWLSIDMRGMKI